MYKNINKKGQVASGLVTAIVGVLLVVVLMSSLAPEIFSNLANLTTPPSWFIATAPVIVAAGFIMMIWRMFK